ncbi:carbohydrate-binding protein, partial [Corynebacterium striatum]
WAPPWQATATYAVGDIVASRGGFWECIKTHKSKNIYEPGSDYGSQDYYWRMYRQ